MKHFGANFGIRGIAQLNPMYYDLDSVMDASVPNGFSTGMYPARFSTGVINA